MILPGFAPRGGCKVFTLQQHSHEAIIPKDIFMMVQEEMGRRAHLETATGRRSVYSGKYALSSIVYCGHCGDVFQRTHWNCRGRKKVVWG